MLSAKIRRPGAGTARTTLTSASYPMIERGTQRTSSEARNLDDDFMARAIAEAKRAYELAEVPVGAIVVLEDRIIGRGHNRRESDEDPLAHAEVLAIREAARNIGHWRLLNCTLYVTLEPCAMCAGALVNSRISRLVFGAWDPKAGFCGSLGDLVRHPRLNHRLEVTSGVKESECSQLLKGFFSRLREGSPRRDLRQGL